MLGQSQRIEPCPDFGRIDIARAAAIGEHQHQRHQSLDDGGIAALLRERGRLDTTVPLAQLEADADITAVAAEARDDDDFSSRIRRGLWGFSGTR